MQSVAVGFALAPSFEDAQPLVTLTLWIAVVLTLVTGAQYVLEGSRSTSSGGVRGIRGSG
jgi:phosphatidylglycerophosphate synthase